MALGLVICMVVLPLLCLPFNLIAAKKLKLTANMPVNLRKNEDGTVLELTVQNPSPVPIYLCACRVRLENQLNGEVQLYDPLLRRLAEAFTNRPRDIRQPVLRPHPPDLGHVRAPLRLLWPHRRESKNGRPLRLRRPAGHLPAVPPFDALFRARRRGRGLLHRAPRLRPLRNFPDPRLCPRRQPAPSPLET